MKQTKRYRMGLASTVILAVTIGLLVLLGIALYNHTLLETRFDTLIRWFRKIDEAVARLDTTFEIVLCIFALYMSTPDTAFVFVRNIGYGISARSGACAQCTVHFLVFCGKIC